MKIKSHRKKQYTSHIHTRTHTHTAPLLFRKLLSSLASKLIDQMQHIGNTDRDHVRAQRRLGQCTPVVDLMLNELRKISYDRQKTRCNSTGTEKGTLRMGID